MRRRRPRVNTRICCQLVEGRSWCSTAQVLTPASHHLPLPPCRGTPRRDHRTTRSAAASCRTLLHRPSSASTPLWPPRALLPSPSVCVPSTIPPTLSLYLSFLLLPPALSLHLYPASCLPPSASILPPISALSLPPSPSSPPAATPPLLFPRQPVSVAALTWRGTSRVLATKSIVS